MYFCYRELCRAVYYYSVDEKEDIDKWARDNVESYQTDNNIWEYQIIIQDSQNEVNLVILKRQDKDELAFEVGLTENIETQLTETNPELKFQPVDNLNHGDQIEIRFKAKTEKSEEIKINVKHGDYELKQAGIIYQIDSKYDEYRYVFRNQLPLEPIEISIRSINGEKVEFTDFNANVQRVDVARHYLGKSEGTPHRGGVSFDLLSRQYVPENM